jgi:acetyl-CoA carboxylase carboxyltransferase component
MSDYTIFVERQAQVFLGGPPLVKMATGEVSTAEELGGAEMHARVSGLADQMARDEFEAIVMARRWVYTIRRAERIIDRIPVSVPLYPHGMQIWEVSIYKKMNYSGLFPRIFDSRWI